MRPERRLRTGETQDVMESVDKTSRVGVSMPAALTVDIFESLWAV
jgi:hypothetical protein